MSVATRARRQMILKLLFLVRHNNKDGIEKATAVIVALRNELISPEEFTKVPFDIFVRETLRKIAIDMSLILQEVVTRSITLRESLQARKESLEFLGNKCREYRTRVRERDDEKVKPESKG